MQNVDFYQRKRLHPIAYTERKAQREDDSVSIDKEIIRSRQNPDKEKASIFLWLLVNYFSILFSRKACSGEETSFPHFSTVLPIRSLTDPYHSLFGFERSSDKLHSLGPKNVRRTSEETPKKTWSG